MPAISPTLTWRRICFSEKIKRLQGCFNLSTRLACCCSADVCRLFLSSVGSLQGFGFSIVALSDVFFWFSLWLRCVSGKSSSLNGNIHLLHPDLASTSECSAACKTRHNESAHVEHKGQTTDTAVMSNASQQFSQIIHKPRSEDGTKTDTSPVHMLV